MSRDGINCPKCSKDGKPILTKRRYIGAGTTLAISSIKKFQINHPGEFDYCLRCRSYYPVELKGIAL